MVTLGDAMTYCVCNSDKAFDQCCRPFLDQVKFAKTPQQLMRSRYSAFALGGYGTYLLETWVPEMRDQLNVHELSLRSLDWERLEIVNKSQQGDKGVVEFKAYFLDQYGSEKVHHEVSQFLRRSNRWLYVDGHVCVS